MLSEASICAERVVRIAQVPVGGDRHLLLSGILLRKALAIEYYSCRVTGSRTVGSNARRHGEPRGLWQPRDRLAARERGASP